MITSTYYPAKTDLIDLLRQAAPLRAAPTSTSASPAAANQIYSAAHAPTAPRASTSPLLAMERSTTTALPAPRASTPRPATRTCAPPAPPEPTPQGAGPPSACSARLERPRWLDPLRAPAACQVRTLLFLLLLLHMTSHYHLICVRLLQRRSSLAAVPALPCGPVRPATGCHGLHPVQRRNQPISHWILCVPGVSTWHLCFGCWSCPLRPVRQGIIFCSQWHRLLHSVSGGQALLRAGRLRVHQLHGWILLFRHGPAGCCLSSVQPGNLFPRGGRRPCVLPLPRR